MYLPAIAHAERVIRRTRKTRDTAIADCLEKIPAKRADLERARRWIHPADKVRNPQAYYQAKAHARDIADMLEMYEHFLEHYQHGRQITRREYRRLVYAIKQELANLEAEIMTDPDPGKVKDFKKAVRRGNAALEALQRDLYRDTTGPAEIYTPAGQQEPETRAGSRTAGKIK